MEIHAPEAPIHSFRDILLHLGIVTIGILIALSLEGLVEWQHHRELAFEARENITTELRDNRAELDTLLRRAPGAINHYTSAISVLKTRLVHHKPAGKNEITLAWEVITLGDSSWVTAQTVGALNYMGYAEVKRYAPVYSLQNEFLRMQQKSLDAAVASITLFSAGGDPDTMSDRDMLEEILRLQTALASMHAESQIGESLSKEYAKALGSEPGRK